VIDFEEFQNRILVVGHELPSARALGTQLRQALRTLRSKQAERIRISRVLTGKARDQGARARHLRG